MGHAELCKPFEEFVKTIREENLGIHPKSNGTYTMNGRTLVPSGNGFWSRGTIFIDFCPCCGKKLEE